ncbi:uncharacterized protein LOC128680492 [Plodia interpunctella]|uniref:uncharacterized protein LOC128680492 n=1 Tax=Plodia interpunctella TaxID=58824 RepID=UPI0023680212|nr:uncharacterized protein LOC128680492 [Plodia interpunctella]XP_053619665.1 uncharacterized protein LOC128680492 [Plodia interpunctella]
MAKIGALILLCQIITVPILGGRSDDENPFLDMASSFLQNMGDGGNNGVGLDAIGSVLSNLMQQKDTMNNLGAMLGQNLAGKNQGGGSDLLSGLGSLLGGQDGKMDPTMMINMVSMFAQMGKNEQTNRQKRDTNNDFNLEGLMNLASGFIGGKSNGAENILPLIMNGLSSLTDSESQKRAEDHKDHADFLPPFLEKVHLYWDLFINSELGKTVWEKSGLRKAMKAFIGPDGKVSFELMLSNFENHSFRRHWIKAAAKYLTDTVVSVAKPEVYQRYMTSIQYILNSFLDAQGLPKSTHLNLKNPTKSISSLVNFVLKKYLDIDTDVTGYVAPSVEYIRQTLKMGETVTQSLASRGDYNTLVERITDALNMDVIEPVLRVYRAYLHSVKAPHCSEHLMCLVNKHSEKDKKGFKAGLTKLSSLAACAALSFQNGGGFWDLYSAMRRDVNCEAAYPADCSAFHEHELKVTTEVYHSEL